MFIQTTNKYQCYGCGICEAQCPAASIDMTEDAEGFRYPQLNEDSCIHCNRCIDVCPYDMADISSHKGTFYAAQHTSPDILARSQSGGAFAAMAEYILAQEGVVYGAIINQQFQVQHARATTNDELLPMHGSKYVQSIIPKDLYESLERDLKQQIPVLFVGTPCQSAAVQKNFGHLPYLYTVDFACHGTPSPKVWEFFFGEKSKDIGKLRSVQFRHITPEISGNHAECLQNTQGVEFLSNDYSALFYSHLIHRPSCYHCQYANINRYADITIGGFLDKELLHKEYKHGGISMVFTNTSKGKKLWQLCCTRLDVEQISDLKTPLHNQPCLYEPVKQPSNRKMFWTDLQKHSFAYIIKKYATNDIKQRYKLSIPYNMKENNEVQHKYNAFVENDIKNNGGLIVNQMEEVLTMMNYPKFTAPFKHNYLNSLLNYATSNSEFYAPYHKSGREELCDFPVVNKPIIRDNLDAVCSKQLCNAEGNCVQKTSGSTGTPFSVIWNHKKHMRLIADMKFYAHLAGVESHERICCLHAFRKMSNKTMAEQERDNVYNLYYSLLDDNTIADMLHEALNYQPKLMIGYGSMWDAIAAYIEKGKAEECKFKLQAICSEADHLKTRTKDILEKYFDCPVYSRYGNMENGIIGQEDETGRGFLLNTASYEFEILKIGTDEPVSEGEVGRIVITDLFNYATPMIRYDTGDLGAIETMPDGKKYLINFLGRITDVLYTTKGELINQHHVVIFSSLFPDIKRIQFIQEGEKEYRCKLVTDNHTYEQQLLTEFRNCFGEDGHFIIDYVDDIPLLPNGKFQLTVCKYRKQQ